MRGQLTKFGAQSSQTGDGPDFLSIIKVLTTHGVEFIAFLFPYSRSAVNGLIRTARSVGIRQAKVAARLSIIITNAIVTWS